MAFGMIIATYISTSGFKNKDTKTYCKKQAVDYVYVVLGLGIQN